MGKSSDDLFFQNRIFGLEERSDSTVLSFKFQLCKHTSLGTQRLKGFPGTVLGEGLSTITTDRHLASLMVRARTLAHGQ